MNNMSVVWTTNVDGAYEVASSAHLLQIMQKGALGSDTNPPTDYWASSYLQTSDIDLVNDHASIVPIGNSTTKFTGQYDGGLFQIKNWSNLTSATDMGLFGHIYQAVLKHIRLSGVWIMASPTATAGFFCGALYYSDVSDVEGDFSPGTLAKGTAGDATGGLIGNASGSRTYGLTVRGTIDFEAKKSKDIGGIIGTANGSNMLISHCRNFATFTNGIKGRNSGGILGRISVDALNEQDGLFSMCQNSMNGDIVGDNAGGVCGDVYAGCPTEFLVNSMTGNITGSIVAGGIFGQAAVHDGNLFPASKLLNYMTGQIVGQYYSGGIIGYVTRGSLSGDALQYGDLTITKSVVAMNGNVNQSVIGSEQFTPSLVEVTVETSFGMTHTLNNNGSATMVVDAALVYDPSFTDLPYFKLDGADPDGTLYDWDFVYANIAGKTPAYTHLSAHTAEVSAPFYTDFGLASSNNNVYLTYANADTKSVYIDAASLTIVKTEADSGYDFATSALVYETNPYDKTDFLAPDGNYDLTEAGDGLWAVVNDTFTTGDSVIVSINNSDTETTFVNRGGDVSIEGVSAILLPFDTGVTGTQDATMTLSDDTSVLVGFDQASGGVSVGGTTYSDKDQFVLDGRKVIVHDI